MDVSSSGLRTGILSAIGLLILAPTIAYFTGAAIEHQARTREATALDAQLKSTRSQLASAQAANTILTADIWAYRALASLDNRNFGLANEAVAHAAASLNDVKPADAKIDGVALHAAQIEAAGVHIYVATDLETQRRQLLHLVADIDGLGATKAINTP